MICSRKEIQIISILIPISSAEILSHIDYCCTAWQNYSSFTSTETTTRCAGLALNTDQQNGSQNISESLLYIKKKA